MPKVDLAYECLTARYRDKMRLKLKEYFENYGPDGEAALHEVLRCLLANPLDWSGYNISDEVQKNTDRFVEMVKRILNTQIDWVQNHTAIKYAIRRWLYINSAVAVERYTITMSKIAPAGQVLLRKYGVQDGDEVIHLHVISNQEREQWKMAGLSVPSLHWEESQYRVALRTIARLVQNNPRVAGLFCQDSWVFDPALHNVAADGRALAAFDFLRDDTLVGERFFAGNITADGPLASQFEFALRNPRRRQLFERGEYMPRSFGFFFPRELLVVRFGY